MILSSVMFLAFLAIESRAESLSAHSGATDPLTENFSTYDYHYSGDILGIIIC
jgi:hypothetical protein